MLDKASMVVGTHAPAIGACTACDALIIQLPDLQVDWSYKCSHYQRRIIAARTPVQTFEPHLNRRFSKLFANERGSQKKTQNNKEGDRTPSSVGVNSNARGNANPIAITHANNTIFQRRFACLVQALALSQSH